MQHLEHKPLVSVIMSVYNTELYLNKSIESILNQTLSDFEFIIFDDGSTDRSRNIIAEYAGKDKRIKYVFREKNIGIAGFIKNLNDGITMASGQYIARMDADDISHVNRLQIEVEYLAKHKNVFLVGSGARLIDENDAEIGCFRPIVNQRLLNFKLARGNALYHPTIMFINNKKYKYREKMFYCEDYDLYLQVLSGGAVIACIPEPLIDYRVLSTSVSRTKMRLQSLFAMKASEFYRNKIADLPEGYDSLDPAAITRGEFSFNDNKLLHFIDIKESFFSKRFKSARNLSLSYLRIYGFNFKVVFYGVVSLLLSVII